MFLVLLICVLGRISTSVAGQVQNPPRCLSATTKMDCTVTCTGEAGCTSKVFLRKENTGRLVIICKDGGYACNALQVELPGYCGGHCGGKQVFVCCDGKTNGKHNCNSVQFGPDVQYECRNDGCNSVSGGRQTLTACSPPKTTVTTTSWNPYAYNPYATTSASITTTDSTTPDASTTTTVTTTPAASTTSTATTTPASTTTTDCVPYTGGPMSAKAQAKWCDVTSNKASCLCKSTPTDSTTSAATTTTVTTTPAASTTTTVTTTPASTTTTDSTTSVVTTTACVPYTGEKMTAKAQAKWCHVPSNKASCLCKSTPTDSTSAATTTDCVPYTGEQMTARAQAKWCHVPSNKASCLCKSTPTDSTTTSAATTTNCVPYTDEQMTARAQAKWCNVPRNKASCICIPTPTVQTVFAIDNIKGCSPKLNEALTNFVLASTGALSGTATCEAVKGDRRRLAGNKVKVAVESTYASAKAAAAAVETTNTAGFGDKLTPHLPSDLSHVKVSSVVSTVTTKTTTAPMPPLDAAREAASVGVRRENVSLLLGACLGLLGLL